MQTPLVTGTNWRIGNVQSCCHHRPAWRRCRQNLERSPRRRALLWSSGCNRSRIEYPGVRVQVQFSSLRCYQWWFPGVALESGGEDRARPRDRESTPRHLEIAAEAIQSGKNSCTQCVILCPVLFCRRSSIALHLYFRWSFFWAYISFPCIFIEFLRINPFLAHCNFHWFFIRVSIPFSFIFLQHLEIHPVLTKWNFHVNYRIAQFITSSFSVWAVWNLNMISAPFVHVHFAGCPHFLRRACMIW